MQGAQSCRAGTKDGVATLSDLVGPSLRCALTASRSARSAGPEALDLLKAWGTGHPGGIGTIHAGNALARCGGSSTHPGSVITVSARPDRRNHQPRRRACRPGSDRRLAELALVEGLGLPRLQAFTSRRLTLLPKISRSSDSRIAGRFEPAY